MVMVIVFYTWFIIIIAFVAVIVVFVIVVMMVMMMMMMIRTCKFFLCCSWKEALWYCVNDFLLAEFQNLTHNFFKKCFYYKNTFGK